MAVKIILINGNSVISMNGTIESIMEGWLHAFRNMELVRVTDPEEGGERALNPDHIVSLEDVVPPIRRRPNF